MLLIFYYIAGMCFFPPPETLKKVCFGSTQERKQFPYHCAPDRLGNELAPIRGSPQCGPGCYNNEEVGQQDGKQLKLQPKAKQIISVLI